MADFVLNDESVENSYGFSIATAGINIEQFRANPVMLNNHINNTESVIGKWENIRLENGQLIATAKFDEEDEAAKKIAGKVDRGFLIACSMGLGFYPDDMIYTSGKFVLSKSVLKENSIVAVPANAKALRLYNLSTGEIFTEDSLQLHLSDLQTKKIQNTDTKMNKIILSLAALNALALTAQPETFEQLNDAITNLKMNSDTNIAKAIGLTAQLETAENSLLEQAKMQSKSLLDDAIAQGKILATEREDFEALPFNVAQTTLAKVPAKTSLADMASGGYQAPNTEPKTFDELLALSDADKDAFKAANPANYKQLCENN